MAKESFYFTHDYNARNDPKLQRVLMKAGHEGKSVYWDLVEMMYEEGGRLEINQICDYAFALRTDEKCINFLVNESQLFVKDTKFFWSESVLRRISKRNEKSEKASLSAKSRWENANAKEKDANALRFESEGNAIKERKGKESITPNGVVELPLATSTKIPSFEERCQTFISKFNEIRSSNFKVTDKVKSSLKARLKTHKPGEILLALKNVMKEKYHIENSFKYITPEFILRQDKLEMYLNANTEKEQQPVSPYNFTNHQNRAL